MAKVILSSFLQGKQEKEKDGWREMIMFLFQTNGVTEVDVNSILALTPASGIFVLKGVTFPHHSDLSVTFYSQRQCVHISVIFDDIFDIPSNVGWECIGPAAPC